MISLMFQLDYGQRDAVTQCMNRTSAENYVIEN